MGAARPAEPCGARPTVAGLLVVVLSLGVFAAGILAPNSSSPVFRSSACSPARFCLCGIGHFKQLIFPLGLLVLMVPLPTIVFNQIAFPLQLIASRIGEMTIAAAGIPVIREGNVLELPSTTLAVAEACSGIRSLVSLADAGAGAGLLHRT